MKTGTTALFLSLVLAASPALAKAQPSSLSLLTSAEKSYYDQIFGYTMDNVAGGQNYDWASHSGRGSIHVDEVFVSKSGYPCRTYSETFVVQDINGAYRGTACKRQGADGWCRLKPNNANTCAMEDTSFMFNMPSMSMPDVSIGPVGNPLEGMNSPSSPQINTPNMPETPKPKKPTGEEFADGVTGNAGKAAGKAASSGISWFSKTFGR